MLYGRLICWQLLILTAVNCHNLIVKTESGPVRGVSLTTYLKNKTYNAYRGIPYAEPPLGELRFKVNFTFISSDYSATYKLFGIGDSP